MRSALRGALFASVYIQPKSTGRGGEEKKICELCHVLLQNELMMFQRLADSCACHESKHRKWCWIAVVLGGRPSIKWDMACEWSVFSSGFSSSLEVLVRDALGTCKTLYNIPLLWLDEIYFLQYQENFTRDVQFVTESKGISCYTSHSYLVSEVCKGKWYVLDQLTFGKWEINVMFNTHSSDLRHFLSTQTLPCLYTLNMGPLLWTGSL